MAEYRGLTIRIGADTGKFTAALKAVNGSIKSTQYQLNGLKRALVLDPGNKGVASAYMGELQSQSVAAQTKISMLKREMEDLGSAISPLQDRPIAELSDETDNAVLSAKRATEAYNYATEAIAQWNKQVSGFKTSKELGITWNAENDNIDDLKALYDLAVEGGEKTRAEADAEIAQLDRLRKAYAELKAEKSDADKISAFQKDSLDIAKLTADINSLSQARADAMSASMKASFEEDMSTIRNLSTELEKAEDRFSTLDSTLKLDPTNIDVARQRLQALGEMTELSKQKSEMLKTTIQKLSNSDFAKLANSAKNLTQHAADSREAFIQSSNSVELLEANLSDVLRDMNEMKARGEASGSAWDELVSKSELLEKHLRSAKEAAEDARQEFTTAAGATFYETIGDDALKAQQQIAQAKSEASASHSSMTTALSMAIQQLGQYADRAVDSVVDSTIEIDDALTNAKKTVNDLDEEGFQRLKDSAIELSKVQPIDAATILNAEALGGQLGFLGNEVEDFARVATGLDVATNMDWETAANNMARFFNIMSPDDKSDIENYGSAIVELGNNFATTESEISDMAMRIAGAGASMHLGKADVLGLATALTSVGLSAEAGGSSISQIMVKIDKAVANATDGLQGYADDFGMTTTEFIQMLSEVGEDGMAEIAAGYNMTAKQFDKATIGATEDLKVWAETAGMTADKFAEKWETRPIEALTALFSGMDKAADEESNLSLMLEDLGITTIRQSDVARRVANSSDILVEAVDAANAAYASNTALSTEVARRNESLSAKVEMAKNAFTAIKEELGEGLSPLLDGVVVAMRGLSAVVESMPTGLKTAAIAITALTAAGAGVLVVLDPITDRLKVAYAEFVKLHGSFGDYFSSIGTKMSGAAKGTSGLAASMGSLLSISGAVYASIGVMAVGAIAYYAKKSYEAKKRAEEFRASLNGVHDAFKSVEKEAKAASDGFSFIGDGSMSVSELTEDLKDFEINVKSTLNPMRESNDLLDEYQSVIERFSGKGKDFKGDTSELEWAVRGLNAALGTNITTSDVLANTYETESQATSNLCDYIDRLIEKRQLEAELAANEEVLSQTITEHKKLEREYDKAEKEYEDYLKLRLDAYKKINPDVTEEDLLNNPMYGEDYLQGLHEKMVDTQIALKEVMGLEQETKDEMKRLTTAQEEASRMSNMLTDSFSDQDFAWGQALSDVGITDIDLFCTSLAEAGVQLEDLQAIMNDPNVFFADMVRESEGDVNKLSEAVANYLGLDWDGEHIIRANADEAVEESERAKESLESVEGAEPAPIEITAEDQTSAGVESATASVDSVEDTKVISIEAQDNTSSGLSSAQSSVAGVTASGATVTTVATADTGSALEGISAFLESLGLIPSEVQTQVNMNGADQAMSAAANVTNAVNGIPTSRSIYVNLNANMSSLYAASQYIDQLRTKAQMASGGIRVHADDFRYHADGFIANRTTLLGDRDIVGEAGAEAVIPLTNRKYVSPFADTVAERMLDRMGSMEQQPTVSNTYVIDGLTVAPDSALAKAMDSTFDEARRYARMGRR